MKGQIKAVMKMVWKSVKHGKVTKCSDSNIIEKGILVITGKESTYFSKAKSIVEGEVSFEESVSN